MNETTGRAFLLAAAVLLPAPVLAPAPLHAQDQASAEGTVERVTVHGTSLEGNLSGDDPARDVSVYLPPSYHREPDRRFPVVYMLHGFTDNNTRWYGIDPSWISLPDVIDRALPRDDVGEMIVVMPNAYTRFQGSMYSSSVTTGDWEAFVAEELVAYVDENYRTIPAREARGLAGHSMGGYGALRIGMKRTDVFAAVYALSACCLPPRTAESAAGGGTAAAEAVTSMEEFGDASFGTRALIASAAAWAPNPANPPFFLDLPTANGEVRHDVLARFAAASPLAMLDQHVHDLRTLEGLGMDAGRDDRSIAAATEELHRRLEVFDVPHFFELYDGDHTNRVDQRIETRMLPFFTRYLEAGASTREGQDG